MISWLCGRRSMGKSRRCRSGVPVQPVAIWGVSELVNQVSKTSVSARKPPGRSRWASVKPGGVSDMGSTGRLFSSARIGRVEVALPVRLHRVPDREGHAEVALAADAPVELQVLGPVAVAQAHEVGMPGDAVSRLHELRLLVLEDAHEPLARGDELERPVALLVELHRVLDRLRLGHERRLSSPVRGVGARRAAARPRPSAPPSRSCPRGARRPRWRAAGSRLGKASVPNVDRARGGRPGPRPGAAAASARATTARPSGRRTCRPSGCRCPSPCPRAGSRRWARAPGRSG